MSNNAIQSFHNREKQQFTGENKQFDAQKYIRELLENYEAEGQLILDFIHDVSDENGDWLEQITDYRMFELFENTDIDVLEKNLNELFKTFMEIAGSFEAGDLPENAGRITIFVSRLSKLIRLGTPAIIINSEKKHLIHSIISVTGMLKMIGKAEELPE